MKESSLPLFTCPRPNGGGGCGGALVLRSTPALPITRGCPADEIREGLLHCITCGQEHPVLSGVAILTPHPDDYLRRYYHSLRRDLARYGALSDSADVWLTRYHTPHRRKQDYGADFRFSQQFEDAWDVARAAADDPPTLYGPFAEWLAQVRGQSPYAVLSRWAAQQTAPRRLALDTGCGAGGLASRVTPLYQTLIGVDLSFLAILLARKALLHSPAAERSYLLTRWRGDTVERPLPVRNCPGAEFVVADCTALPFPVGLFDAVFSSNVIDIASMDDCLDEAVRTLDPAGSLFLTDPFYFRDGEAPREDPRRALRAALNARCLEVREEQDGVPWAWSIYDRHWRVYFNYCCVAQRTR